MGLGVLVAALSAVSVAGIKKIRAKKNQTLTQQHAHDSQYVKQRCKQEKTETQQETSTPHST